MSIKQIQHQHFGMTKESNAVKHSELSSEIIKEEPLNKHHKPTTDPNETTHQTTIQQLLNQQSEKTRQNITKRSVEQAQEKGLIHNEELQEEINKELEKQFSSKFKLNDQPDISEEYRESLDHKQHEEGAETFGQYLGAKKANKKKAFNAVKNHLSETIDDESDNHPLDKLKPKSTIQTQKTNKEKQMPIDITLKDVKEYAKLMSQYAISQDPNKKQLLDRKKQVLLQKGVSTSQINHMSTKVGQVIKQHMMYDLKQKLIRFHMSKGFSKQEQIQKKMQFDGSANQTEQLSNTPNASLNLTQTLEQLQHEAKQDLGNFLYEESVNQFTKYSLGQSSIEEFTDELVRLQKAAQSAGFDISEKELTEKIYSAIDHLGLSEFKKPDTNTNQQRHQPQRQATQEEILDDKLRYLYMMKALHPTLRKKVSTYFKIKKCKNGLIKLGFYTEEKENELKKQGEFLAINKFKEELHFIFREEATLPHLSGGDYGALRKKQAFIIKQIRSISSSSLIKDIETIREQSYREMYSLMKEELLQLKEMAAVHQHVSVTRKIKHLKDVIHRIQNSIQLHDFSDNINSLITPKKNLISEHA